MALTMRTQCKSPIDVVQQPIWNTVLLEPTRMGAKPASAHPHRLEHCILLWNHLQLRA